MASATRQFATCLDSVHAEPTTRDSIIRLIRGMSVPAQIALIVDILDHDDYADFDIDVMRRLDVALADLRGRADDDAPVRYDRIIPDMAKAMQSPIVRAIDGLLAA